MLTTESLPNSITKNGFSFPHAYLKAHKLNLTQLEPWSFIPNENFETLYKGIETRYPKAIRIPFARRIDCDDVACFELNQQDNSKYHVTIIHDYVSEGWEVVADFPDFWSWFRQAIEEMIEYNT